MLTTSPVDAVAASAWYRRNRQRSAALFDLVDPTAYYTRPISLRNPIVFYEGHMPAFSVLAFLRRGLRHPSVDARLDSLCQRAIDPDSEAAAVPRIGAGTTWPPREEVLAFARACDEAVLAAIADMPHTPEAIEGLYTALEHEAMHQETLLYMWHRLPYEQKRPVNLPPEGGSHSERLPPPEWLPPSGGRSIPAGDAAVGADRGAVAFGWDNEFDRHIVHVDAFEVDTLPVTNAQFLEFMNDRGYNRRDLWSDEGWEWIHADRIQHPAFWLSPDPSDIGHRSSDIGHWQWRGMFGALPLPPHWPVYVSHAEAAAYARWKGRRLMTEAEWHRAAEGATAGHADFAGFEPIAVGAYPETASVHGVQDLIGNGWEWTSTVFAPFEGFTPMRSYPEYSADFFDGRHFVMKGASPATARELIRPSFRNWFRGNYPYVYAKFRTAR